VAIGDPAESDLRDYLSALRRRKRVVVLTVVVAVFSALVASFLQTDVYEGTSRLLLKQRQSPLSGGAASVETSSVETEMEVMRSEPVVAAAREKLGVDPKPSISRIGSTAVVEVRIQSTSPVHAADLTNGYVDAYLGFRLKQTADQLQATVTELQGRIDALQKRIDELGARIASLPPCGSNPTPVCDERNAVQRDRDSLLSQQVPLRQQLDQIQVNVDLKSPGAELITPASVPTDPVAPKPVRNALLAFGFGLVVGIGLALLFEHLDDSVRSKDDLERASRGLPVLGMIPSIPDWKDRTRSPVVSLVAPSSAAAEAYRTLRTSIRFMAVDKPLGVIEVTSPSAGEGKTTTTANLAVALARAGERVVIVSCDLRRPRLHDFFGLSNKVGFTSVLLGEAPLSTALQPVTALDDRLWLLASGPLPPNPSELLSSPRAGEVLNGLRSYADTVIVDCPPMLPVTDAVALSDKVDATVLVVSAGTSTRKQMSRCVEMLRQVGAPLVGAVLNNAPTEAAYGYAYAYYGQELRVGASRGEDGQSGNGKVGVAAAHGARGSAESGGSGSAAAEPATNRRRLLRGGGQPRRAGSKEQRKV
jgi:succinoglycan biosynthesis transport protein ExoP